MFRIPFLAFRSRLLHVKRLLRRRTLALCWRSWRRHGFLSMLADWFGQVARGWRYRRWIRLCETQLAEPQAYSPSPLISLAVPVFETPPAFLSAMIESVVRQTYPHWELCLADGGSRDPEIERILEHQRRLDPRIKVVSLSENRGIAGNSNAALDLATGAFVGFLDHDDMLAPTALAEVANAIQLHPRGDLFYSDEDKVTLDGRRRFAPHFKPDWAPDSLRSQNYITHLCVVRRSLLQEIGGFRVGFDGSQDYDLILRACERARDIVHIPRVLYHWRSHPHSTAQDKTSKSYAYEAGKRALEEHLQRTGLHGKVDHGPYLGTYHITYARASTPTVSLIAPEHDSEEDAVDHSIRPSYPHLEIITVRKSEVSAPLSTRLNAAATQAKGEVLLFVGPHLRPLNEDWIERLLEHALRPDVGAVGARIAHPDGSIAHAGIVPGLAGAAGYPHRYFPGSSPGYGCRLVTVQNLSAVSGSCLMTSRKVFEEVGGFDSRYARSYHDVDYCLKVRQRNYLVVWTSHAQCCQFRPEKTSMGTPAQRREDERLFRARWLDVLKAGDPYYNANLTEDWEDFSPRT